MRPYSYADGNPLNATDPSGLQEWPPEEEAAEAEAATSAPRNFSLVPPPPGDGARVAQGYSDEPVVDSGLAQNQAKPELSPDIEADIQKVIERYPATSGQCKECAREIQQILSDANIKAEIRGIAGGSRYLVTVDNETLAEGSRPFHVFARTGDTIYDALAGASGESWTTYQQHFDDIFWEMGEIYELDPSDVEQIMRMK